MSPRPLIGITCGTSSLPGRTPRYGVNQVYVRAVEAAGGAVVMLPPMARGAVLELVGRLDGLLVPGGADVHPSAYGEAPRGRLDRPDPDRDALELTAIRAARRRGTAIFGICRGQQVINVAFGGSLVQDIRRETRSRVRHDAPDSWGRDRLVHDIDVIPGSWLAETAGATRLTVNSSHHQAVARPGRGLRVTATAADGVVEATQTADGRVVTLQCHPEELVTVPWARALFRAFVKTAGAAS